MLMLTPFMLLGLLIPIIMYLLNFLISEKSLKEQEKMTPFECGFSPFKKTRSTFSLRFFITTLIFLIFDVEVAILLPIGIVMKMNNFSILMITSLSVTIILLLGLLHEWKLGALNWVS